MAVFFNAYYGVSMNDAKKHQWILIILTLAIVVAVAGLLARCYYELSGVMYGDTMIFQTVGRGMLKFLAANHINIHKEV